MGIHPSRCWEFGCSFCAQLPRFLSNLPFIFRFLANPATRPIKQETTTAALHCIKLQGLLQPKRNASGNFAYPTTAPGPLHLCVALQAIDVKLCDGATATGQIMFFNAFKRFGLAKAKDGTVVSLHPKQVCVSRVECGAPKLRKKGAQIQTCPRGSGYGHSGERAGDILFSC